MVEFILEGGKRTSVNPAQIAFVTECEDTIHLADGYSGPLTAIGMAGRPESFFNVRGHYGEVLAHLAQPQPDNSHEQG